MIGKSTARLLGCALAGLAPVVSAHAEDGPENDILVTARHVDALTLPTSTGSRLGLTSLETPASIAPLGGGEIRARGDLSVVDAVTRAPGITTSANPGNGGTALVARGFNGQGSVLQLYDGVRLFPVAGTITFPVDPWNVERIEVLSGPASVLYGQGALGGAVNVITRQPEGEHNVLEGEAGYGSQDSWHVAVDAGGPLGEVLSYRADVSYRRSDGYVDRGRSKSLALSGALRFAPSDAFSLTVRDDYGNQRPTEYFGTPLIDGRLDTSIRRRNYNVADASLHYRDNRLVLTAEWRPSDAIGITNTAYRLTSKRLFKNLESYCWIGPDGDCPNGYNGTSGTPGTIYRTDNFGIVHDQTQYGDQGSAKISTTLGKLRNDLIVGFDVNLIKLTYSNDFGSDVQEDFVDPRTFDPGLFFDTQGIAPRYRTRTTEYSVFAEDRLQVSDKLSVVGGIRHERDRVKRWNISYDTAGNPVEAPAYPNGGKARRLTNTTWRVGAVYRPASTISLYGQYATGVDPLGTLTTYSPSNANNRFYFTNAKGDQIEAGVKASFLDGHGSATIAAYRIVKKRLVAQRTLSSPVEQVGQRSAKGIEASISLELPGGFGIDANGTVLDAKFDDFISDGESFSGNTPPNIPERAANLWLRWEAFDRFRAQLGLRYVGRSFSDNANEFRVSGYTVADGGVSYALSQEVALDARVYNIFDKDYATTTYNDEQWILGRPRSLDISVRANF